MRLVIIVEISYLNRNHAGNIVFVCNSIVPSFGLKSKVMVRGAMGRVWSVPALAATMTLIGLQGMRGHNQYIMRGHTAPFEVPERLMPACAGTVAGHVWLQLVLTWYLSGYIPWSNVVPATRTVLISSNIKLTPRSCSKIILLLGAFTERPNLLTRPKRGEEVEWWSSFDHSEIHHDFLHAIKKKYIVKCLARPFLHGPVNRVVKQ